jgi:phage shock protein PspC (stress-responsive transcriptional regulator)
MNTTDEAMTPPVPPPPDPPRRLLRSTDDKVLAGVCGGLGHYFAVDPVVFRIAFVVLALVGGTGFVLYGAAWLVVPDDHSGTTVVERKLGERSRKLALAVLGGLATFFIIDRLTGAHRGDRPLALVLVAIGAAVLFSRQRGPKPQPPSAGPPASGPPPAAHAGSGPPPGDSPLAPAPPLPPSPPETPSPEADAPTGSMTITTPLLPPSAPPPAPPPAAARVATLPPPSPKATKPPKPPKPPKPRSVLVLVTLRLLAVLAGGFALLGVTAAVGLALALLVTGAALVVGAWRGRARWLIPVALVLGAALAVASVADVPLSHGTGERIHRPVSLAALRPTYRLGIGHLVVDLRNIDFNGETRSLLATDGIGELEVIVPSSVEVVAAGHVGAGDVRLFGTNWDGTHVDGRVTSAGQEGGGRLVVRARVGIGQVRVNRAAA